MIRLFIWIIICGFAGFFLAGKSAEIKVSDMVIGTLEGAVIGLLIGLFFILKDKNKRKKNSLKT